MQTRRSSHLASLLCLSFGLSAVSAEGAPRSPVFVTPTRGVEGDVEAAEQAYANLDYAGANTLADRVSKQRGLSHDQLVRITRLLALTSAALDKPGLAREAFIALIGYEPDYQLDAKLGPRFQDPYFEAKGFWKAQSKRPGLDISAQLRARSPGTIRVALRDPINVVRRVVVGFRWSPSRDYTQSPAAPGAAQVDIPIAPTGSTRLDFYAQAFDERDDVVLEAGSPDAPRSAAVESAPVVSSATASKSDHGGVFSKPLFWVAAAALVAGGATGGYFLLKKPGDEVLPATSGRLSPGLACGGARCP